MSTSEDSIPKILERDLIKEQSTALFHLSHLDKDREIKIGKDTKDGEEVTATPRISDIKSKAQESLSPEEFLALQQDFKLYLKTEKLPMGLTSENALNLFLQGYLSEEERQKLAEDSFSHQKLSTALSPRTQKRGLTFVWEKVKSSITTSYEEILKIENPPWDAKGNMEAQEAMLANGNIVEVMDMREYLKLKNKIAKFAGEVYIVFLHNGTKAVWKPRDGDIVNSAVSEVAAYKASLWLKKYSGRHLVPPTVIKTYRGRTGSLQWFVESNLDLWVEKDRVLGFSGLSNDDLSNGAAFIHVFGQWDVHPGNYMMMQDGDKGKDVQLALIDNEGIANRKFSRSIKERPYIRIAYGEIEDAPPQFVTVQNPKKEELQKAWSSFGMAPRQFDNLYLTLTGNGTRKADYMLWKNGLWVQYHQQNKEAFPNYVDNYPEWLEKAYNDLDLKILKEIFSQGIEALPRYFDESFFQDILLRREQLQAEIAIQKVVQKSDVASISMDAGAPIIRLHSPPLL